MVFVKLIVALVFYCVTVNAGQFDGCSLHHTTNERYMTRVDFKEFQNNKPKPGEILRSKSFFNGLDFSFGFSNNNRGVYVSINETSYKTYRAYDDYLNMRNVCSEIEKPKLPQDFFTEVDFIVSKRGVFSVIIYGRNTITLSCNSLNLFDERKASSVYVSYNHKQVKAFLYDCAYQMGGF